MTEEDVAPALQLIEACDDEEVVEARADYAESIDDQFVLEHQGRLLGVTGFEAIEGTDRSCWLGWTFMDPDERTPEMGAAMMRDLLVVLRGRKVRKLFVQASDWFSGGLRCSHRFQREVYESAGFVEELRFDSYYGMREAMIGFGLHLATPLPVDPPVEDDDRAIVSLGVSEIDDGEGISFLDWGCVDAPQADGIAAAVDAARRQRVRAVFASAASHAVGAAKQLQAAGFRHVGRWADFHEDGLHDEQFRCDLW
jgi:GNAT superfamily N-acetyltransferase